MTLFQSLQPAVEVPVEVAVEASVPEVEVFKVVAVAVEVCIDGDYDSLLFSPIISTSYN